MTPADQTASPTPSQATTPEPAPMTPALLKSRSEFLVNLIRKEGITNMTRALALAISDKEYGGNSKNVDALVPQLGDSGPTNIDGYSAKLDVSKVLHKGKPVIMEDELNTGFFAAAVITAKTPGMQMKDVPPEEIFQLVPEIYKKIQQEDLKCACL